MSASQYRLFDLIQSHRITQLVYVAAKLGIAEALRQAPRPADELAAQLNVNADALRRLLTALVTIDVCERRSDGRYAISETGSLLDGTSASSLRSWAIFETEMIATNWQSLLDTVKTGLTPAQRAGASSSFELMARSPERIAIFNAAMADLTRSVTPALLRAYDFSRISHLMDVGGGAGEFVAEAAQRHPRLRATVFDLARCEAAALQRLEEAGVNERVSFVAGDFFRAIPAASDTILMKSVIHDWDDERSVQILRNCRAALPKDGTLLLVERVVADCPSTSDDDRSNAMSDLNMMCGPGGRERTRCEYERLLTTSGFRLEAVHAAGRFSAIEARPA